MQALAFHLKLRMHMPASKPEIILALLRHFRLEQPLITEPELFLVVKWVALGTSLHIPFLSCQPCTFTFPSTGEFDSILRLA